MTDVPKFDEVVEGYAVLGGELIKKWSPYLTSVSGKVAAGAYQSADAEADFSAAAKLMVESMVAIGSEAIDAVSILTSDFSEHKEIGGFSADPAHASTTRTLAVKADLVSVSGQKLPKARVKPVPDTLPPQVTAFDLDIDGDGIKARTYDGVIVATDTSGKVEEIKVSVTVG